MANPKYEHENTPGQELLIIHEFKIGEQRDLTGTSHLYKGDITIANLKKEFGGKDEGEITSFVTGRKHHVSLKQWANTDPDKTMLKFEFRFRPDRKEDQTIRCSYNPAS